MGGVWDQCHEYWLASQVDLLWLVVFNLFRFFFEIMFLYEDYHSNHPNKYDLNVSLNKFLIVL
jgi:hypothetical protein